jgi:hypothetical protein
VVIEFPQAIEGNIIKLPFCGGVAAERPGGGGRSAQGKPIVALIDSTVGNKHLPVSGFTR